MLLALLAVSVLSTAQPPLAAQGALRIEECEHCKPKRLCKTHRAWEKAELAKLTEGLSDEDPRARMRALSDAADLTDEHENAPSAEVAEVLVAGLNDPNLAVQRHALRLLARDQHPESAVVAIAAKMRWYESNMWSLVATMTGPKAVHGTAAEAMDLIEETVRAAATLPDDRIAKAMVSLLQAYPSEMHGEPVAMATTSALLKLGTPKAIDAVIGQLTSGLADDRKRKIHFALTRVAGRHEIERHPRFEDGKLQSRWSSWVQKNKRVFPKKLGKWTGPPAEDESLNTAR